MKKCFVVKPVSLLMAFFIANTAIAQMDHSQMNHGQMDHSKMGHDMANMSRGTMMTKDITLPKNQPLQPLPLLKNQSNKQGVFKAELTPSPIDVELVKGIKTTMWLYNQTVLPLIEANIGDTIELTVNNKLPESTTVHWHGIAVPPDQDGNPQDPIKSGESHTYQFTLGDEMAGPHWFHPHTHNLTAEQVYKGLAGGFIVRDPNDPLRHIPEQNLLMIDLKLDANGQIPPNNMMDVMNGREGQFVLVNGQVEPIVTLEGTQRLRFWNGNSARYLNLYFPEDKVDAYLVATDGGLIEHPQKMTTILLTPGERAEIVVTPKSNDSFDLISLAYDRKKMGSVPAEKDRVIAKFTMIKKDPIQLPEKLRTITDFGTPTKKHTLEYTEEGHMNFLINGNKHDMARIDLYSKVGEVEEWEIYNNSHMDHNFHLHGPQFIVQEYEKDGVITKPTFKMLKDTINLRPYEKARVITVQNAKGIRMYHCHILEHEDAGMMGQLQVN